MKIIYRWFIKPILWLLGLVILYILAGLLLPLIPISKVETNEEELVTIYIKTNGVHTDLVVPTQTQWIDWNEYIPYTNTASSQTNLPYIAFGWGDKGFYLDTPEWSDLKFSTAFKAMFWLGESAMHCTYIDTIRESDKCKKITLTVTQYKNLVAFIKDTFKRDANGNYINIPTDAVYGKNDAFYEANGSYSIFETCNTWANNGLKTAGQKAALWTPTDFGIFRHYQ